MTTLRWAVFLAFGLALPWALSLAPHGVEVAYGRVFFPGLAEILGPMGGLWRFDLAPWLIFLGVTGLVLILLRGAVAAVRQRSPRAGFGPGHLWIAFLAILAWGFHLAWGLNYARPPLGDRIGLEEIEPDAENLARLTRVLAAEVNRTYAWAVEGGQITEESPSTLLLPPRSIADRLDAAYDQLQPRLADIKFSPPKLPHIASWVLTRMGISGFYFPFTGEATVNRQLPEFALAFAMAHEMAHQRGTAREDEANFLAYLACRESGLAAARYGGALGAFGIAYGALWRTAPDSVQAMGAGILAAGPRADRAALRAFWQRHEGPASHAAHRVNDAYLKANAQRAGTASYSRAVRLLVALESAGGIARDD